MLLAPGVRRLYRPFLKGTATIFLLHRFADPEHGIPGHDPAHLRRCLQWLRDAEIPVLSLGTLARRVVEGRGVPPGAVCFTVDDGYSDFHRIALPIFAEYDCPVTVFLPTGFVDGGRWLWWDQIAYVVRSTDRPFLRSPTSVDLELPTVSTTDRQRTSAALVRQLERLPHPERVRAMEAVSDEAGVPIPDRPPSRYEPMTWSQVREAEEMGARFAPHSVTHPVLSRVSDERLHREIRSSWKRLRDEVAHPVPVFGYPLGADWAFGEREMEAVQASKLLAAVSTRRSHVRTNSRILTPDYRWRLPRLGLPREKVMFLQIVSGLLRLRHSISEQSEALFGLRG